MFTPSLVLEELKQKTSRHALAHLINLMVFKSIKLYSQSMTKEVRTRINIVKARQKSEFRPLKIKRRSLSFVIEQSCVSWQMSNV